MTMMGLYDTAYWLSWLSWEGIIAIFSSLFTVLFGMMFQFDFFLNNNFVVLFLLFFLFQLNMIGFAFMLSTFISKSSSSTTVGFSVFIIGFLTQLVTAFGFPYSDNFSSTYRSIWSLFPPNLLSEALQLLADATSTPEDPGISWSKRTKCAIVIIDSTTGLVADFACEVEITDCEPLPDERFFLEVESRRRCRILRNWDQDGYRVAEIEWVQDICPAEGTRERLDLQDMINKAAAYARSWMKAAQEAARGDQVRLAQLFKAEGLIPTTRDPESFSFWLATLTNRRPSERLDLLRIRDTNERIRRGLLYMKAEEQGCRLQ